MLSLEILNKYKIPAIFFLATKNIKEDKSFWWDVIYKYRIKGGSNLESIRKEQRFLKSFNHRYICEYIENMFGVESFKPWSEIDRPLSENEVQSISVNPYVSIGNHTHNHAILTNCERQEIKYEINECNKILNDLTGKIPSIISFPNGNFNKLILEITEDEGFHFAFTTQQEINRLPVSPDKLLCLNRFVTGTDKITKAGGFYRLGYDPDLLFSSLKVQISSFIKGTKH
jgi:peptidoglycan/xylan/chitin deacetylase (PgdA/CDA1 family)